MVMVMCGKLFIYLIACTLLVKCIIAKPKWEENNTDKLTKQQQHHHKHYEEGEHNTQYDHEAFLGADEAKTFEHLTPDESQRRLAIIVDRIDDDKDGFVSQSELQRWIHYTQRRYIDEDLAQEWKKFDLTENDTLAWATYRESLYGFLDNYSSDNDESTKTYERMLKRDLRRWGFADKDQDDALNKEEFKAFLHPEEYQNEMREVVLLETLEDLDRDEDGKVSVDEYIGDMYEPDENEQEEPDWVVSERETFAKFRDTNGDGFLDKEEVRAWIIPDDYNSAEAEAKHLIFEADQDDDQRLTKQEILDKYDLFVGSQATNFGDELVRHDEF